MLGAQQAAQPANAVTDSDQIVGQSKIDGLNREINQLKAEADTKTKEIIRLEREIGIKRQTTLETVAEKLEPVKTVVVGVAGKVAQKAQALTEKISSRPSSKEGASPPPAELAPEAEGEETPAALAVEPTAPTSEESAAAAATATPATEVAPANVARNKLRIATLQEEVSTLNDTIKSKESEVAWLYKKHGLVRPGSFAAFKSTAANKLVTAKDRTKEGASQAKDGAVRFWKTASATIADKSKVVGSAASQKWAELVAKTKGNPGDKAPAAKAGGSSDDMTQRYS